MLALGGRTVRRGWSRVQPEHGAAASFASCQEEVVRLAPFLLAVLGGVARLEGERVAHRSQDRSPLERGVTEDAGASERSHDRAVLRQRNLGEEPQDAVERGRTIALALGVNRGQPDRAAQGRSHRCQVLPLRACRRQAARLRDAEVAVRVVARASPDAGPPRDPADGRARNSRGHRSS